MYIFKNIFKNISIFKGRNILMFIIVFIMSSLCCISLIVWQAAKKYENSNTSFMRISVNFGADVNKEDMDTALIIGGDIGTRISFETPTDPKAQTLDELHKYVDMGNPVAVYDIVTTHLAGSESFKSYILDSDRRYSSFTKSKVATAFSDRQYVNITRYSSEEFSKKMTQETFYIEDGKMYDENTSDYECIIDLKLANERNVQIEDEIDIYLNNIQYKLKVTGIYSNFDINNYAYSTSLPQSFISAKAQPSFYNRYNPNSVLYFPSIYVNGPFYEEIQFQKSLGVDLDFSVIGLPSDEAIGDFISGNVLISHGRVFDPSSDEYECVISEDLAKKNGVKVGDEIILRGCLENSKDYAFKIVGIYQDSQLSTGLSSFFGNLRIPLDKIYMSFSALTKIIDDIDAYASFYYPKVVDMKLVFQSTQDINDFYRNVTKYDYRLREKFVTAAGDTKEYFNQLTVIKRTTSYALMTFIVELVIAIVFLFMFNAYNLRERQYEIGVLTSMGMSKGKIAMQFFSEIIVVVLAATLLGSALGTIASGSVGDYLTKQNIESREDQKIALIENFGREVNMPSLDKEQDLTIDASISAVTLLWLWGAFIAVTIISTSGTVSFILSFEPVSILNDRQ